MGGNTQPLFPIGLHPSIYLRESDSQCSPYAYICIRADLTPTVTPWVWRPLKMLGRRGPHESGTRILGHECSYEVWPQSDEAQGDAIGSLYVLDLASQDVNAMQEHSPSTS